MIFGTLIPEDKLSETIYGFEFAAFTVYLGARDVPNKTSNNTSYICTQIPKHTNLFIFREKILAISIIDT